MPFDEIPGLFPKNEEEQIAKDNQASRDRLRQVLGTPYGIKTIGGQTWQVYNKGTAQHPYYIRVAPDPRNPNNLQVWDYTNPNERNPPPSTPIGSLIGDEQLENVRQKLAEKYAYNPRTQQPWNPAQSSYGEVKSAQRYMQTYENWKQPSGALADSYTHGGNALNLFEDIEKQWNAAGGSAGLNKAQQFLGQFKRETDIEKFYNNLIGKGFKSTGDAQTDAALMFMRDMVRLKGEGQDITHLQGTDAASQAVADGLNGVLGATGIFHPIIAGIAGTGLEAFKSLMKGTFNTDDFRALEPQAKLQLAQLLYNRVHNDTGPGQVLLDQPARDVGNHAKKIMENAGMSPEDNSVPGHAGILQEPGADTTQAPKAQPAGTTVKKAIPVTPGKAPIQTTTTGGTKGTTGGQRTTKGTTGVTTTTGKMSDQETLDRAQIVNTLKQQPGREKEDIHLDSPEVTTLYNQQKGIKTPQTPTQPTTQQPTTTGTTTETTQTTRDGQLKTNGQQTVVPVPTTTTPQTPATPTTPQQPTAADMKKPATNAGQVLGQTVDAIKKEILGIAGAKGDSSAADKSSMTKKASVGDLAKGAAKPEAAVPSAQATLARPAPTLETLPAGAGQLDQERIPYAPITQTQTPSQTNGTGATSETTGQIAGRALQGDRNAAQLLVGNDPQSVIQNEAANRAAQVEGLNNPNWRPNQNPLNQIIDTAAGKVGQVFTRGWGENPNLRTTTPTAATDAQSAVQNAAAIRAAEVAKYANWHPHPDAITSGAEAIVLPRHFVAAAPINQTPTAATDAQSAVQNATAIPNQTQVRQPVNIWDAQTWGSLSGPQGNAPAVPLRETAPGVLKRLVFPVPGVNYPSPADEQRFEQQQEMEQQDRARRMLEGTLPQDAAVGAPLGAPDYAPLHLHHQGHVDSLTPGTPFYWRDHPGAYVKV